MKVKFIPFTLLVAVILSTTACKSKLIDENHVKNIKTSNNGIALNEKSEVNNKNTNIKKSNLKVMGKNQTEATEEEIKSIIKARAIEVLTAIKKKDMKTLSKSVHKVKGVRFSPYAYVNVNKDIVLSAAKISKITTSNTKYLWGNYDGSGETIKLTFNNYYNQFIYDVDFLKAKEVGYNKILGKGNTTNNSFKIYKNSIIVEYHFSGFDPKYGGIDWKSLRLVFEKQGDKWYLVGVIHDQWTI